MDMTERLADMTAPVREVGEQELITRTEIREQKYPTPGQSQTRYRPNLFTLFDDSEDIHKVIYTTNAIEALNRMLRDAVETEGCFPQNRAALKVGHLATDGGAKQRGHVPLTLGRRTESLCVRLL